MPTKKDTKGRILQHPDGRVKTGKSDLAGGFGVFNGSTNSVSLSADIGVEFEIEVTVKTGALVNECLFSKNSDYNQSIAIDFTASNTVRGLYYKNDGSGAVVISTSYAAYLDGGWHTIKYKRLGDTVYLYIDNVLKSSATNAIDPYNTDTVAKIGSRSGLLFFNGRVAFAKATNLLTSSIVFETYFEAGAGVTVYDVSDNGNHGTVTGNTAAFWGSDNYLYSYISAYGYNIVNGVKVPALKSDPSIDVLGNRITDNAGAPIFSISANSFLTKFDETNAEILKSDSGNGFAFVPVAGADNPVLLNGRMSFAGATTAVLRCDALPKPLNLSDFSVRCKLRLNSATGNDFTILSVGETGTGGNIAFRLYADAGAIWVQLKKSASYQGFGIDVSGVNINEDVNLLFGVKDQTAYLQCANYFKKADLGEAVDPAYATQVNAGGVYGSATLVNGFALSDVEYSDSSLIDPALFETNTSVSDYPIVRIIPHTLLPKQPFLSLTGVMGAYSFDGSAVEKWVSDNGTGEAFAYTDGVSTYTKPIKSGDSVQFGGAGYGLIRNDASDRYASESFTVAGWVYVDSLAVAGVLLRRGKASGGTASEHSYSVYVTTSRQLVYSQNDNIGTDFLTSDALPAGWHYIVAGRDAVAGLRYIAVGGKFYSTANLGSTAMNNTEKNVLVGENLEGFIRELAYYPYTAISPANYMNGQPLPVADVLSLMKKIEGVEVTHRDRALVTNTSIVLNSIKSALSRLPYPRLASDIFVRNNYLEQTVDNVSAEALYEEVIPSGRNLSVLTFSGWYNITTLVSSIDYFNVNFVRVDGTTNNRKGYAFRTTAAGGVNLHVYSSNTELFTIAVQKNEWLHVLLSVYRNVWVLYVNGKIQGSGSNMNTVYSQNRYFIANRMQSKFSDIKIEAGISKHTNFKPPIKTL